ncbi:restriction endonuclease subunit S [Candidatus Bathyarchaeota archaeon]|nr:restriction endonuclease subunit S [Candidatus Bathyarchaeota archaeon]
MKRWPTKLLSEIAEVRWGNTSLTKASYVSEGFTAFSATGPDGFLPFFEHEEDGIILSAIGANCGKCYLAKGRWTAIKNTITITNPADELCAIRYLYYFLNNQDLWPKRGGGQPFISQGDARKVFIPVPPVAEQERIVMLLDEADELRKLRAKAERRTAELIPALFHEMFGDSESEESYKVRLGEIAEVKSGAGFPLDRQGRLDQPIPFFKVGDMNTQGNEWAMRIFQHTISETTRKKLCAALLPANSVIFPKVGAAIGTNKKRVIVCPSCVDNNVMAIIPSEKMMTEFLLASLEAKNLMDFASNSNPPSIRKTTIEDWRIMLPPLSQQKKFADRVTEIRMLESDQAASRLRLEALFQSLLHHAFNGEL